MILSWTQRDSIRHHTIISPPLPFFPFISLSLCPSDSLYLSIFFLSLSLSLSLSWQKQKKPHSDVKAGPVEFRPTRTAGRTRGRSPAFVLLQSIAFNYLFMVFLTCSDFIRFSIIVLLPRSLPVYIIEVIPPPSSDGQKIHYFESSEHRRHYCRRPVVHTESTGALDGNRFLRLSSLGHTELCYGLPEDPG
ncbi:hypothetical protein C8Q69DRAFT_453288 [Paecilomyces variotii]|uniref:Uncharacterized protein n=1 Tax=Byssochlamys spectabilis TaxID=264951 RepID=A0A443I7B8_BYSSP|nr:hypothetical protein C8Q69DRAFT_453288 [Paecilomyces variotii]RWQ99994.1 hypothetical protein C8Q69DRAFT_453288 [Paecilomyces variotii]